jgi:uncharacterized protein YjeT (DUF2065 family)
MEHTIPSWPILVAPLVLGGIYLVWLWMRPQDLVAEITKIKTQNYRLFGEVQAVAGAIADLPIPNNAAPNLTSSDQVSARRLEFSRIIDEGAGNIVAASERARQTIFTMYPALPDLREDQRRALLRDLELVAIWEGVLLKRLHKHAQAIRERLLQPDNSEEQALRLLGKGEQTLRLLGVIWPQREAA